MAKEMAWSLRLCALTALLLPGSAFRKKVQLDMCANLSSSANDVLGFFRPPETHSLGWFNYLIWLDQSGLADGGGMKKVDPEALAYFTPPQSWPGITKVNRCGERRWSLYGNHIPKAGDAELTKQGDEFVRGFRNKDRRCELKFDWNAEGTKARCTNYIWATLRIPFMDSRRNLTIEVNPPFKRLFQAASQGEFWPALQHAVAAEGEWGRTCCPGAFDTSGPLDVVAACRPPLVQQCALWLRRNQPHPEGQAGYQLYAVGYKSGSRWAPVQETGATTAYAQFADHMKRIGLRSICFERDS